VPNIEVASMDFTVNWDLLIRLPEYLPGSYPSYLVHAKVRVYLIVLFLFNYFNTQFKKEN